MFAHSDGRPLKYSIQISLVNFLAKSFSSQVSLPPFIAVSLLKLYLFRLV